MVKTVIWVVVGLLALSFFGISLRSLVESPTNQDNLMFVWNLALQGWHIAQAWFATLPAQFPGFLHTVSDIGSQAAQNVNK